MQYNHGRDRHFRPIIVFRAAELTGSKINHDEAIKASFYSSFYFIDRLCVPGKVENWNLILDLDSLAISKLPIKFMIKFIQLLQDHEKWRTKLFFVLNVTFGIRLVYRLLSPFIDEKIKENLKLSKDSTHPWMLEHIHPSQLEQKYGGDANNLDIFWPPRVISDEYGHDPEYIFDDKLEDALLDHIVTPYNLKKNMENNQDQISCVKNLSFLPKKSKKSRKHKSRKSKQIDADNSYNEECKSQIINKVVEVEDIDIQVPQQYTENTHSRREEWKAVKIANKGCNWAIF